MNDEWTPAIVDDPAPPEPDAAVLARVVGRGRQRLVRRRAIFGAVAAAVAVVLVGSGVAVAQRRDASPDIAVNPTTTIPSTSATVREADQNGIHFTLTLLTPVVHARDLVRMTLHEENRADYAVHRDVCSFDIVVLNPHPNSNEHPVSSSTCVDPGGLLEARSTFDVDSETTAPAVPGVYGVVIEPILTESFPPSLIRDPFPLTVVAPDSTSPVTPATGPNVSEPLVGPSPTSVVAPTTNSLNPQVGDFSAALTADRTTVAVGGDVNVDLNIRNVTDHEVEASLGSLPNSVAIVCAPNLTSDGATTHVLRSNENLFFVTSPSLKPGESSGRTGTFHATDADIGTITCVAEILTSNGGWQDGTIRTVGRLTNVPAVSFTVTPAGGPSRTPTPPESTTSTTLVGP